MESKSVCSLPSCPSLDTSALRSCPCRLASYCSKDCQAQDWPLHLALCPPFTISQVPGKGRGLVATRRLRTGATVLREKPIISLPTSQEDPLKLLKLFTALPSLHKNRVLEFYDFMGKDTCEDSAELMAKLVRIVKFNSIKSEEDEEPSKNLYFSASLINHSCAPNLVWYPEQGHLVARLLVPVRKGGELTVCYFPCPLARYTRGEGCPTRDQRRRLLAPYRFHCRCALCLVDDDLEERRREQFQELDRRQEVGGSLVQQLENARSKLSLVESIGGQEVFIALVDCWKLSEFLSAQLEDASGELEVESRLYRERAEVLADILGPAAREVLQRFSRVYL